MKIKKLFKRILTTAACFAMAGFIGANAIQADAAETVPARFFVLNRGLAMPSEPSIGTYPTGNYSAGVNGSISVSYSKPYGQGEVANVSGYMVNVPTKEQLSSIGVDLADYESISWYVIKTEDDGIHVDGYIKDQRVTVTVLYGYIADNGQSVELADRVTKTCMLGDSYSIPSPSIAGYTPSSAVVSGTASETRTYTILYTQEATQDVVINYYRSSVSGTLLGTATAKVGESQLEKYYSNIENEWLNLYKPTDCYSGTLAGYYQREDGVWVANIVYAPIPVTPVNPGSNASAATPDPNATDYVPSQVVITNDAATAPEVATTATTATTTTRTNRTNRRNNVVVNNVDPNAEEIPEVVEEPEEPEEEIVEIPDEEVPLASEVTDDNEIDVNIIDAEEVELEDELVPLSGGAAECALHWIMLVITAVYAVYTAIRFAGRNKKLLQ